MAGSEITAVPQWVAAKTIAATDPPNDTNWLEILQTHADRQEYNRLSGGSAALSTWVHFLPLTNANRAIGDALIEGPSATLIACSDVSSGTSTGIDRASDWQTLVAGSVGGATTGGFSLASDEAGTICCGCDGDGSGYTIVRSTDYGANWAVQTTVEVSNGYAPALVWNGTVFVNAIRTGAGPGNAKLETSPDGGTWTSRTNPLSNDNWASNKAGGSLTDGEGTVVLIPSDAAQAAFAYSADGLTWSATTGVASSTWEGGAYSSNLGWIAFDTAGANIYQSTNGSAWTDYTTATVPAGLSAVRSVAAAGDILLLLYSDGTDTLLVASLDWGVTWTDPLLRLDGVTGTTVGMRVSSGRLLVFDTGASPDTIYVSARAF